MIAEMTTNNLHIRSVWGEEGKSFWALLFVQHECAKTYLHAEKKSAAAGGGWRGLIGQQQVSCDRRALGLGRVT